MATVTQIGPRLGIAPTCAALGLPRATYYRRRRPARAPLPRRPSPRALSPRRARRVLALLHEPRFVDLAPAEVYATLLDEGSTLLRAHDVSPPGRSTPRCGSGAISSGIPSMPPRSCWPAAPTSSGAGTSPSCSARRSGPTSTCTSCSTSSAATSSAGWWRIGRAPTLAEQFIRETCARQGIDRGQLTIHADRGPAMTSKPVAFLLADLGVTKTHSRPHVSNDNPFSEAQFKTLKYRPDFPARFGSIQDARAHCHVFFPWYNTEHHHSGLGLLTPARRALTAWPSSAWRRGRPCSPRPTPRTRNASPLACPTRRRALWRCGSIRPRSWALAASSRTLRPLAHDGALRLACPRSLRPSAPVGGKERPMGRGAKSAKEKAEAKRTARPQDAEERGLQGPRP